MKYILVISCLLASNAHSFPELIRHGYVSCTACHVSPSGGGTLTPYGRALSGELLTSFGSRGTDFFHGGVKLPEAIQIGGDIRVLQYMSETPAASSGDIIPMQADIEPTITLDKITGSISLGVAERNVGGQTSFTPLSRKYYLKYMLTDSMSLRVGKFYPAYGLMIPDHNSVIRRGIGFDQGRETHTIEFASISDPLELLVSIVLGQIDNPESTLDKGFAIRAGYAIGNNKKIGMSYFFGSNPTRTKNVFGPYALVGFSDSLVLLSELDFMLTTTNSGSQTTGAASFHRLSYEVYKGVLPYLVVESSFTEISSAATRFLAFGIGTQWFPIPHFEFNVQYQRQNNASLYGDQFSDFFMVLGHYYF